MRLSAIQPSRDEGAGGSERAADAVGSTSPFARRRARTAEELDLRERKEAAAISQVELLLAEKRTSLAVLRTGVSIGLAPLSIAALLVTLSRFVDLAGNLVVSIPLGIGLAGLSVLSIYLITRATLHIHRIDRLIAELGRRTHGLRAFIE